MIDHPGFVLWFTGLPCAGKTTLAIAIEHQLHARKVRLERLDGDTVRQSLTRDLGFSKEDRDKNIERVTFVAKLLSRNNVGVLAAFISPYKIMREHARQATTNFIEVFVDAPLEVCIARDVKGMYKQALEGKIQNFTGVNDPYEAPENPDIHIRTDQASVEASVQKIIAWLEAQAMIPSLVQV
jgi:adenylyl-sulfate kinase